MLSEELLRTGGATDNILLIGGVSPVNGSGGLFLFDGGAPQRIDPIPTAGLALTDRHLVRVLCSSAVYHGCGDVFLYDEQGVERYLRIDGLTDAHDVHWDGESIVCTSSTRNAIMWLSPWGELRRTWAPSEVEDCWHINSFVRKDGNSYCSAFGLFQESREWERHKDDHSGVIYDLAAGRVVVPGLDCPHNPTLLPEGWVVCNSGTGELLRIDPASGEIVQRLKLQNWLRGLAYSDDYFFVGESGDRKKFTFNSSASLCIVDRRSWTEAARFSMPVWEITSLLVAPRRFLPGLQRGFRTNPFRESDYGLYNLFYKTGTDPLFVNTLSEPLPAGACKVRLQVESPPQKVDADAAFSLNVTLENLGTGVLASKPPNPVYLSARWFSQDRSERFEGRRNGLSRAVLPGYSLNLSVALRAPSKPGQYKLRISPVQEWVAWFDDIDPANGFCVDVTVGTPGAVGALASRRTGVKARIGSRLGRLFR
jgi:Domain of unknown function (DUF4915)